MTPQRFFAVAAACIVMPMTCVMAQDKTPPPVVHSAVGTSVKTQNGELTITLVGKKQQFDWSDKATLDRFVNSPKSANVHPDGKKLYINSLEGCATVVYDMKTFDRLKVIDYNFDDSHAPLWSPTSKFFPFTHYTKDLNRFAGKPVESAFSHGGRYLWVPFYRRTYDINAQDPSALAVIDTRNDTIVRLMETGPLPKMIACSPDNKYVAVTHWGNNTVGLIDISGDDPAKWQYVSKIVIDRELKLDLSLTVPVNRDSDSGYCLRGTTFTPDGRYLLVSCMTGANGIAVIDMQDRRYMGRVLGTMPNVRHLVIKEGWLYLSINASGYVQRIRVGEVLNAARGIKNGTTVLRGWEQCKVPAGARTIELSPSGHFVFAACNLDSKLAVVDTRTMKLIGTATVDSYPVGLAITPDGRYVIVTSQGRTGNRGGNAVNIFRVDYAEPEPLPEPVVGAVSADSVGQTDSLSRSCGFFPFAAVVTGLPPLVKVIAVAVVLCLVAVVVILIRRKR